jgi:hypothetical protein
MHIVSTYKRGVMYETLRLIIESYLFDPLSEVRVELMRRYRDGCELLRKFHGGGRGFLLPTPSSHVEVVLVCAID